MIFSLLSHRFLLVVSSALFPLLLTAQTPLANRVKAMARHLPAGAEVVSKYTDNHRHCLYYTLYNRLFRYDVVTNKSVGVEFSSSSYARLLRTFLSPDGNCIFVVVRKTGDEVSNSYNMEQLWRYDSRSRKSSNIGSGFSIVCCRDSIIIKKVVRSLNPSRPFSHRQWIAKDHYYDFDGHMLDAKDEYRLK